MHSYPKPGKIWTFILLQCTSSSPKIYSDPHFSVYKGQKMQCIMIQPLLDTLHQAR